MNATLPASVQLDVGRLLDEGPWSALAKVLVCAAAIAMVLDGFDIQALSFALPIMIKEWHVARSEFAPVVAIGLIGMTMGAALGGMVGDRIGRKGAVIGSVALFGTATAAMVSVTDLQQLAILRFVAGAGIGGALPNASALTAEFTPLRHRACVVTLTIVCVPLGGMVGGLVAARVLPTHGWRALFVIGGVAPMVLAGVLTVLLRESPRFLARRPLRARELAALLSRLGHEVPEGATFADLAESRRGTHKGTAALLSDFYRRDTLALWGAFFFSLFCVYSMFSWGPTLLTSAGLDISAASSAVATYNLGGVVGTILCAGVLARWGSRILMTLLSALGALSALALCFVPMAANGGHAALSFTLALHGFSVCSIQTMLYTLAAHVYLTDVRSTGSGMALSVGRLGAVLSSFTGAVVVSSGPGAFYLLLAAAMVGNGVCLALVGRHVPELRHGQAREGLDLSPIGTARSGD